MKPQLAMKFIAEQMDWSDAEASEEFRWLQVMANYKYDHYMGYQPGSRFYLALLGWLNQFENQVDKKVAFKFLKERLVFISQREMHHLISLLTPIWDRMLRESVSESMRIPFYQTWLDKNAIRMLEILRRKTLFIALSDGAKIDVFRRYNEGLISNEQIVALSEISNDKWNDLKKDLKNSLLEKFKIQEEAPSFERVCLVDDFTGSGSSLIRHDKGEWKGKIRRFVDQYSERFPAQHGQKIPVQIHHHLASEGAKLTIEADIRKAFDNDQNFEFTPTFSYVLPHHIVINDASSSDFVSLVKKYYNKDIEDKHTKEDIWFGYKQSGLPIILEHNTPNNSLAILWAQSPGTVPGHKIKPLFMRRKRHSSHG